MNTNSCFTQLGRRVGAAAGLASLTLACLSGHSQSIPPDLQAAASSFKNLVGDRVEASDVLSGDWGMTGGSFEANNNNISFGLSKFGGGGDLGDVKPLGDTGIGWQPRLQGSMGYLQARNNLQVAPLAGDVSRINTYAVQFGGGARLWLNDRLSLAPTVMGMYGNTQNSYTANNPITATNWTALQKMGVINGSADTWAVIPAADLQYIYTFDRTIFTLSSDYTYYHLGTIDNSTPFDVSGHSETWKNKLDVDVPLGKMLWGHELRTGGYFSRTEYYDDIKTGLNSDHLYEFHARIVLDFLGQLWKVQWIGLGASYLWSNSFDGYAFGADIAFRF